MGLAISKRLVELMGGTMWVESEGIPGQGSTFHFTIQAEVARTLAPRPHLQTTQPRLAGKRVLIVDDNATNRHILRLQTGAWGMQPSDTGSPSEALDWVCRGEPFDVALVDMQMPEMDGIMLASEIRRVQEASQLPIVMLSSIGQRDAQANASALDRVKLEAYLLKPIKASQLYNVLVSTLGAAQAPQALQEPTRPRFDAEMGRRHPLSILLAEDNVTNQKLALLVLERLGYRADVAANGFEVLQSLRRQPYDVVLMDVQMPEMDGLEATRKIVSEFSQESRPRIVAMTANVMKEDRDECFAAGMDDFLTKPIQLTELVAALNRCPAQVLNVEEKRAAPETASVASPQAGAEAPVVPGEPMNGEAGVVTAKTVLPKEKEQPGETAPPVIDPAALERLSSNLGKQAQAMLPVLLDTFFKDAPRLIAEAQRSLAQGQPADLRRAAHNLKSNSATFGAMALSILARELEYQARDGVLEGASELLERIQAAYTQAKAAIEARR